MLYIIVPAIVAFYSWYAGFFSKPYTDMVGKLPTSGTYRSRRTSTIQKIIIHHSAMDPKLPIRHIADYHTKPEPQGRGWPGIGYHFVITQDGTVYRTNPVDRISYHVSGHNTNSIGICMHNTLQHYPPPRRQLYATRALIRKLRRDHPTIQETPIFHNELSSTECPGRFVTKDMFK